MSKINSPKITPTKPYATQSETDIPATMDENILNITTRYKRQKMDYSPPMSELCKFQAEMREMFQTLQANQCAMFNKLSNEISAIKLQNDTIRQSNLEIEKSIEAIKMNYQAMKANVDKLKKSVNSAITI